MTRRSHFAEIGNNRFSIWLSAFADLHAIVGSALQGLLFGVGVLPFYLLLTRFNDPASALVVCGSAGVVFGLFMYFLHQWRRRTDGQVRDVREGI